MTNATAATTGFTGSEATARLREKIGKAQLSFLALSMMAKMKGKTNKAIRNDLGDNCPGWISKIFTMADKVMAHVAPSEQDEISRMTVANAEKSVVAFIERHMTALGQSSFEKYGKVCHFVAKCEASELVLNPPKDEAKPETEAEAEAKPEAEANTAIDEAPTTVATMLRQVEGLDDAELAELAAGLNALMMKRAEIAAAMPEVDQIAAAA